LKVTPAGKPPANAQEADRWLKDEIAWGDGKKYRLDEGINWWHSLAPGGYADGSPSLPAWGMVRNLQDAYVYSGDPTYAEGVLKFVRSFYRKARPLGKADWGDRQFQGPWTRLWASGRILDGYGPTAYRAVGRYAGTTDA